MNDVLKKEITVTMTVREALSVCKVMYYTSGEDSNSYHRLTGALKGHGDILPAIQATPHLERINYLGVQGEVEKVFLRGNKSEAQKQIDKLEENVKQLQAQIQELRSAVEEG